MAIQLVEDKHGKRIRYPFGLKLVRSHHFNDIEGGPLDIDALIVKEEQFIGGL